LIVKGYSVTDRGDFDFFPCRQGKQAGLEDVNFFVLEVRIGGPLTGVLYSLVASASC
jgi:hypothetical protein